MSMIKMSVIAGLLAAVLASCDVHAADRPVDEARVQLDETVISGSQELPKVLYIVPWQSPGDRPALPAPDSIVDDELFRPVRPTEHHREMIYLENLRANARKE